MAGHGIRSGSCLAHQRSAPCEFEGHDEILAGARARAISQQNEFSGIRRLLWLDNAIRDHQRGVARIGELVAAEECAAVLGTGLVPVLVGFNHQGTLQYCGGACSRVPPHIENHRFRVAKLLQQLERLRLGFDSVKRRHLDVCNGVCDQPTAFGFCGGKRLLFVVLAIDDNFPAVAERDGKRGRK